MTLKLPPIGPPTRVPGPVARSILARCALAPFIPAGKPVTALATLYAAFPFRVIANAAEPGWSVGPITVVVPLPTSIANSTVPIWPVANRVELSRSRFAFSRAAAGTADPRIIKQASAKPAMRGIFIPLPSRGAFGRQSTGQSRLATLGAGNPALGAV